MNEFIVTVGGYVRGRAIKARYAVYCRAELALGKVFAQFERDYPGATVRSVAKMRGVL